MKVTELFSTLKNNLQARWNKPSGRSSLGRTVTPAHVTPAIPAVSQPFSQKTIDRWKVSSVNGEPLISLQGKKLKSQQLADLKQELFNHYKQVYEHKEGLANKIDYLLIELGLAKGAPGFLKPSGWFSTARLETKHLQTLDRYLAITDPVSCGKQMLDDGIQLHYPFIFYFLIVSSWQYQQPSVQSLIDAGLVTEQTEGERTQILPAMVLVTREQLEAVEKANRPVEPPAQQPDEKTSEVLHPLAKFNHLLPAMITPENFIGACLALEQSLPQEDRNEIIAFMADPCPETVANLCEQPSVKKHPGLAAALSGLNDCQQAGNRLYQLLDTIPQTDSTSQCLNIVGAISQATTSPEVSRTMIALQNDIKNNQLTPERLQNYLLVLSVAMPSQLTLLSRVTRVLHNSLLDKPPANPIQEDSWSQSFHNEMKVVRAEADKQLPNKPRDSSKLENYLILIGNIEGPDNTYDRVLTRLHNTIASVAGSVGTLPDSMSMKSWLTSVLPNAQTTIGSLCQNRLPIALCAKTETVLSSKKLRVQQKMAKAWQEQLDGARALPLDRASKPVSSVTGNVSLCHNDQQPVTRSASTGLNRQNLGRFTGSVIAGRTLSNFVQHDFSQYARKLDQVRLREVTPFELEPDLDSPDTDIQYEIHELPDGNYKVQQSYTVTKPFYKLNERVKGKLGLQRYRVTSETTVTKKKLLLGKIEATEPQLTVSVETGEQALKWYQWSDEQEWEESGPPYL